MSYETLNCGDLTCPFNTGRGTCEFDKFVGKPCEDLEPEEFEQLKIEIDGVDVDPRLQEVI